MPSTDTSSEDALEPKTFGAVLSLLLNIAEPKLLNVIYVGTWALGIPIALVASYFGIKAGLPITWYVAAVAAVWVAIWDTIAHLKYNLPPGPAFDKLALLDRIMVNYITTPILVLCYGYTLYAVGQDHFLFWYAVATLAAGGTAIVPFPYPGTGNYQNPHYYFHKLHMIGHLATPVLLVLLIKILADASIQG